MAAYENWHIWIDFGTGYVDITATVDSVKSTPTTGLGDGKETSGEPGQLHMVLNNHDHRYTPGNQTSNMALATGMPVKVTETIGIFNFDLHTGTLEFPEISDWAQPIVDQQIVVSSVDQLSRWERGQTMISTLGAQILYGSGSSLAGYWPCVGGAADVDDVIGNYTALSDRGLFSTGIVATDDTTENAVIPQGSGPVLEDDVTVMRLDAALGVSASIAAVAVAPDMRVTDMTAGLVSGQVATLVAWYYPQLPLNRSGAVLLTLGTTAGDLVKVSVTDSIGSLSAVGSGGAISGTITGPSLPNNVWIPIALRYGYNAGTFELWVGAGDFDQYTGSLTGTPGSNTISFFYAAQAYAGGLAHVQFYIGAATDYTYADYQDQAAVAATALKRQTTGDRIRTLAAYGGLTDAQMADVDIGCSVMQPASLAGKTFAAAMYEARDTEQGRLFVAGGGGLTFHDRRTVLNV